MRTDLHFPNGPRQWTRRRPRPGSRQGLVVAGDVKISLAEVELLTIRIRLIVWLHRQGAADRPRLVEIRRPPVSDRLSSENEELRRQCGCSSARSLRSRRQRATGGVTAVAMRTDRRLSDASRTDKAAAQAFIDVSTGSWTRHRHPTPGSASRSSASDLITSKRESSWRRSKPISSIPSGLTHIRVEARDRRSGSEAVIAENAALRAQIAGTRAEAPPRGDWRRP